MSKNIRNENKIALSYHDSLLRESDVQLLRGPHWINDNIIGFYFEYLDKKTKDSKHSKNLLFASPELTQLLKLTQSSDWEALLDPINAKSSSFIFFPLNNCDSRESGGGTHWSLLVYSQVENKCFHFDSCQGLNAAAAKNFTQKTLDYFCTKGSDSYHEINCPQQDNGYDCGLYVLCFTDSIVEHTMQQSKMNNCQFRNVGVLVNDKRKNLLEMISYLKKHTSDSDQ
ncbi:sentrin-specific protease 8 [Athalia rosae]|uniref:sentrin-specific protease 8 n=1 Tax=Athalia rosae TaxID=37344 RepID=UPI000626342A|nr:sentrin-specific protease 8 [Athalia rosae]XP_048510687.1 sentrin-specific protease 8 [Athalia rosae]